MPKLKKYLNISTSQKMNGFTLIELLIVIVIIGILAGVLISTIDPAGQQKKSRDAVIKSSISKLAFSINSYKSAEGVLPASTSLSIALINTKPGTSCNSTTTLDCTLSVQGVTLPSVCSTQTTALSSIPTTLGTGACNFGIQSIGATLADGKFRIYAKSFVNPTNAFIFDSSEGLYDCSTVPSTTATMAATTTCALVD